MSHTIELRKVGKAFSGHVCLSDISFYVDEGEIVSIIGLSGAGKTTLLRIAANLIADYDGTVLLDGESLSAPTRMVFYIPQTFEQLLPWKTALGNLTFVIRNTKKSSQSAAKAEAMELLRKVRMEKFAKKYPHQLSGGMKQRVAFVRALVMNARVLLLDEPFSAIDAATRKEMQRIMRDVASKYNKAILFVTHNIEDAVSISDRILVIKESALYILDNHNNDMMAKVQEIVKLLR